MTRVCGLTKKKNGITKNSELVSYNYIAECSIWCGSTLFATHPAEQIVKLTCLNFRAAIVRIWGVPILSVDLISQQI